MHKLKRLLLLIRGENENLTLENSVFNLTIFVGATLLILASISNAFIGMHILGVAIPMLVSAGAFWLYYLSRFRKKFLFSTLFSIPLFYFLSMLMWFLNGGQSSSIIHGMQIFFLFFFAILPKKYHIPFTLFHISVLTSLYILEYKFPAWVMPYTSREAQLIDQIVTMSFAMCCVYAIMMSIKAIYEQRNKQVSKQKENLESLNAMKDKMLSVISHDVRGPLVQIKSVLHLANEKLISDEKRNYLFNELYKNVHETQDLLDTLVTWASFQFQEKEPNLIKEKIDLKLTAKESLDLFYTQLKEKKIKIICKISPELYVYSDANILSLIIRNLLSNAIKFSYAEGEIILDARKTAEHIVFSIQDTGVGIAADRLQNLLQFGKNSSTRGTNNEKGSGLGLLLCKDFIEKSGGKLHIESELNKGSIFYVSLPIC